MFREINVAGFVLKNGWVFCQITFLIYMIILAVMDIKRRQVHLGFLLSGIIWVILSVICERTVSTGEIIAGILAGAFFLLISKLTKESFGYYGSISWLLESYVSTFYGVFYGRIVFGYYASKNKIS